MQSYRHAQVLLPSKKSHFHQQKPRMAYHRGVFRFLGRVEPSVVRYNRKFS